MSKFDINNLLSGLDLPNDDELLRQSLEDFLRDEIDYDGSGSITEEEWQYALDYSQQWQQLENEIGLNWKETFVERISDRYAHAIEPADIPNLTFVELADSPEVEEFKASPQLQTQYTLDLSVEAFIAEFATLCADHGLIIDQANIEVLAQALDELDGNMMAGASTADQHISEFSSATLSMALILMSAVVNDVSVPDILVLLSNSSQWSSAEEKQFKAISQGMATMLSWLHEADMMFVNVPINRNPDWRYAVLGTFAEEMPSTYFEGSTDAMSLFASLMAQSDAYGLPFNEVYREFVADAKKQAVTLTEREKKLAQTWASSHQFGGFKVSDLCLNLTGKDLNIDPLLVAISKHDYQLIEAELAKIPYIEITGDGVEISHNKGLGDFQNPKYIIVRNKGHAFKFGREIKSEPGIYIYSALGNPLDVAMPYGEWGSRHYDFREGEKNSIRRVAARLDQFKPVELLATAEEYRFAGDWDNYQKTMMELAGVFRDCDAYQSAAEVYVQLTIFGDADARAALDDLQGNGKLDLSDEWADFYKREALIGLAMMIGAGEIGLGTELLGRAGLSILAERVSADTAMRYLAGRFLTSRYTHRAVGSFLMGFGMEGSLAGMNYAMHGDSGFASLSDFFIQASALSVKMGLAGATGRGVTSGVLDAGKKSAVRYVGAHSTGLLAESAAFTGLDVAQSYVPILSHNGPIPIGKWDDVFVSSTIFILELRAAKFLLNASTGGAYERAVKGMNLKLEQQRAKVEYQFKLPEWLAQAQEFYRIYLDEIPNKVNLQNLQTGEDIDVVVIPRDQWPDLNRQAQNFGDSPFNTVLQRGEDYLMTGVPASGRRFLFVMEGSATANEVQDFLSRSTTDNGQNKPQIVLPDPAVAESIFLDDPKGANDTPSENLATVPVEQVAVELRRSDYEARQTVSALVVTIGSVEDLNVVLKQILDEDYGIDELPDRCIRLDLVASGVAVFEMTSELQLTLTDLAEEHEVSIQLVYTDSRGDNQLVEIHSTSFEGNLATALPMAAAGAQLKQGTTVIAKDDGSRWTVVSSDEYGIVLAVPEGANPNDLRILRRFEFNHYTVVFENSLGRAPQIDDIIVDRNDGKRMRVVEVLPSGKVVAQPEGTIPGHASVMKVLKPGTYVVVGTPSSAKSEQWPPPRPAESWRAKPVVRKAKWNGRQLDVRKNPESGKDEVVADIGSYASAYEVGSVPLYDMSVAISVLENPGESLVVLQDGKTVLTVFRTGEDGLIMQNNTDQPLKLKSFKVENDHSKAPSYVVEAGSYYEATRDELLVVTGAAVAIPFALAFRANDLVPFRWNQESLPASKPKAEQNPLSPKREIPAPMMPQGSEPPRTTMLQIDRVPGGYVLTVPPIFRSRGIAQGSEVYVRRPTSGAIEPGWIVVGFNADGTVHVRGKDDMGRTIEINNLPHSAVFSKQEMEGHSTGVAITGNLQLRGAADAAFVRRERQLLEGNTLPLSRDQFTELFRAEPVQANIGNCYLVAALHALRHSDRFEILIRTSMRKSGTKWEVKVPIGSKNGVWITVNPQDLRTQFNPKFLRADKYSPLGVDLRLFLDPMGGALGYRIIEAAYIKAVKASGRDAIEGGLGHEALVVLLGNQVKPAHIGDPFGKSFAATRRTSEAYNFLDEFHNGVDVATVGTRRNPSGSDAGQFRVGKFNLYETHAYAIESVDKFGKTVCVVNPHDPTVKMVMTYEEFANAFTDISAVSLFLERLLYTMGLDGNIDTNGSPSGGGGRISRGSNPRASVSQRSGNRVPTPTGLRAHYQNLPQGVDLPTVVMQILEVTRAADIPNRRIVLNAEEWPAGTFALTPAQVDQLNEIAEADNLSVDVRYRDVGGQPAVAEFRSDATRVAEANRPPMILAPSTDPFIMSQSDFSSATMPELISASVDALGDADNFVFTRQEDGSILAQTLTQAGANRRVGQVRVDCPIESQVQWSEWDGQSWNSIDETRANHLLRFGLVISSAETVVPAPVAGAPVEIRDTELPISDYHMGLKVCYSANPEEIRAHGLTDVLNTVRSENSDVDVFVIKPDGKGKWLWLAFVENQDFDCEGVLFWDARDSKGLGKFFERSSLDNYRFHLDSNDLQAMFTVDTNAIIKQLQRMPPNWSCIDKVWELGPEGREMARGILEDAWRQGVAPDVKYSLYSSVYIQFLLRYANSTDPAFVNVSQILQWLLRRIENSVTDQFPLLRSLPLEFVPQIIALCAPSLQTDLNLLYQKELAYQEGLHVMTGQIGLDLTARKSNVERLRKSEAQAVAVCASQLWWMHGITAGDGGLYNIFSIIVDRGVDSRKGDPYFVIPSNDGRNLPYSPFQIISSTVPTYGGSNYLAYLVPEHGDRLVLFTALDEAVRLGLISADIATLEKAKIFTHAEFVERFGSHSFANARIEEVIAASIMTENDMIDAPNEPLIVAVSSDTLERLATADPAIVTRVQVDSDNIHYTMMIEGREVHLVSRASQAWLSHVMNDVSRACLGASLPSLVVDEGMARPFYGSMGVPVDSMEAALGLLQARFPDGKIERFSSGNTRFTFPKNMPFREINLTALPSVLSAAEMQSTEISAQRMFEIQSANSMREAALVVTGYGFLAVRLGDSDSVKMQPGDRLLAHTHHGTVQDARIRLPSTYDLDHAIATGKDQLVLHNGSIVIYDENTRLREIDSTTTAISGARLLDATDVVISYDANFNVVVRALDGSVPPATELNDQVFVDEFAVAEAAIIARAIAESGDANVGAHMPMRSDRDELVLVRTQMQSKAKMLSRLCLSLGSYVPMDLQAIFHLSLRGSYLQDVVTENQYHAYQATHMNGSQQSTFFVFLAPMSIADFKRTASIDQLQFYVVPTSNDQAALSRALDLAVDQGLITAEYAASEKAKIITYQDLVDN